MASVLLCITHKNAKDLARGQLGMGRNAKAMSGCLINVVRDRARCPHRSHYLGQLVQNVSEKHAPSPSTATANTHWPIVFYIAIFVLKRDVKLQPTNCSNF